MKKLCKPSRPKVALEKRLFSNLCFYLHELHQRFWFLYVRLQYIWLISDVKVNPKIIHNFKQYDVGSIIASWLLIYANQFQNRFLVFRQHLVLSIKLIGNVYNNFYLEDEIFLNVRLNNNLKPYIFQLVQELIIINTIAAFVNQKDLL